MIMLLLCGHLLAQSNEYLKVVSLESDGGHRIQLTTAGKAKNKDEVRKNAIKSAFHTLFYTGVAGVNDGHPLITNENITYTKTFFDDNYLCKHYIVDEEEQDIRPTKSDGWYQATYTITVKYKMLIDALTTNKVYTPQGGTPPPFVQKTVMAVPYADHEKGESYASVLKSNTEMRIAINAIKNAFINNGLEIVDLEALLERLIKVGIYQENAGDSWSNDKMLLQNSNADVYVIVFMEKQQSASGVGLTLIIEARNIADGKVLGSEEVSIPPFETNFMNKHVGDAAKLIVPNLVESIQKNIGPDDDGGNGGAELRVPIDISIHGESAMTMNTRVGPNNYPLSSVIHRWISMNAHNKKFKRRGLVADNMRYDYVVIPPTDADGIPMDASQFAFLLEMYLSEEFGIRAISRIDGDLLLITIDPPTDFE